MGWLQFDIYVWGTIVFRPGFQKHSEKIGFSCETMRRLLVPSLWNRPSAARRWLLERPQMWVVRCIPGRFSDFGTILGTIQQLSSWVMRELLAGLLYRNCTTYIFDHFCTTRVSICLHMFPCFASMCQFKCFPQVVMVADDVWLRRSSC